MNTTKEGNYGPKRREKQAPELLIKNHLTLFCTLYIYIYIYELENVIVFICI